MYGIRYEFDASNENSDIVCVEPSNFSRSPSSLSYLEDGTRREERRERERERESKHDQYCNKSVWQFRVHVRMYVCLSVLQKDRLISDRDRLREREREREREIEREKERARQGGGAARGDETTEQRILFAVSKHSEFTTESAHA